jgi:hypothetical protein
MSGPVIFFKVSSRASRLRRTTAIDIVIRITFSGIRYRKGEQNGDEEKAMLVSGDTLRSACLSCAAGSLLAITS